MQPLWTGLWAGWGALTLSAVGAAAVPRLARLAAYGKLSTESAGWLRVPKRLFWHFYAASCLASAGASALLATSGASRPYGAPAPAAQGDAQLCLFLVLMHSGRRLYESRFVFRPSPTATMHVGGYLVGLAHYLLLSATLLALGSDPALPAAGSARRGLGALLFWWASSRQHECHQILGQLRADGGSGYHIPRGGLFDLSSSGHYTAEILLYVALALVGGPPLAPVLLWVVANLAVTARATHRWYQEKFKEEYPSGRAILIPYVW